MDKAYKTCECKSCGGEFILLDEYVKRNLLKGKYESCPYCGSRNIKQTNESDNFKECMKHSSYKREHGALRQVRHD